MFAYQIDIVNRDEHIYGIVAADSFGNAVDKLANYYGENNLVCIHELYGAGDIIEMPKEVYYSLEL